MLGYLTRKDKPLSYIETHAGRAIYDLDDAAAQKTGEAAKGIARVEHWFDDGHPYGQVLASTAGYPGSPAIAAHLLRASDRIDLAELHPQENAALKQAMSRSGARCHQRDGFDLAHAIIPPTPRRGLLLVDPSYEIKEDYQTIPGHVAKWHRAWNVGVIAIWYPVLTNNAHQSMADRLLSAHPDALRHEVRFAPARPGHGMVGSGMFVVNPPFGLDAEAKRIGDLFKTL